MCSRRLITGLFLGLAVIFGSASAASAETRTLKIYYVHTKERAEITFKKNGRYIKSGLEQVNHMLRDWRRNEPTNMDPRLVDLLWEVYRASGSRDYIHVVSAYRSPATNSMLRSRSSGVAKNSQHMLGKAVDFYLPDVKLAKLRNLGLKMHGGGVGYYPKSGSPFVHLDVGSVRHWPGISRQELASVFPDGKTVHIPSDGKPMPGYQQALAMVKQRQAGGGSIQMAAAETSKPRRGGGLFSRIFGGGADEAEDDVESGQVQVASAPQRRQAPQPAQPEQPAREEIQPPAPETPGMILAALPVTALPIPQAAPRRAEAPAAPAPVQAAPVQMAAVAPAEPEYIPFGTGTPAPAAVVVSNIPLPTRRPNHTPAAAPTQVAMATTTDGDVQLPATAYVMPSRRPDRSNGADVIANLLAKEPVGVGAISAEEGASLAFAAPSVPAPAASSARAGAEATPQLALVSDHNEVVRPTTRSAVRVAPKEARPNATDLPKPAKPNVQLVSAKVPAIMMESVPVAQHTQGIETLAYSDRLAEVPSTVYTAGFTQSGDRADPRKFSGKAVTFLSIAKFQ